MPARISVINCASTDVDRITQGVSDAGARLVSVQYKNPDEARITIATDTTEIRTSWNSKMVELGLRPAGPGRRTS